MDQILDVDAQPPYVEVFTHHPLMLMTLSNHRLAYTQTSPKELLFWSHGVQCSIDEVTSSLGLYKVKVLGYQGPSCMFVSSPDMPPKQQADVMFTAAKKLRKMLSEVPLPGGDTLASQITIHAGTYAGGVVGKNSWTYDLFGSDVQDLLDMDRFNTPNSIQVSDPALQLFSDLQQFEPACKLVCSGHEVLLHRWIDQQAPLRVLRGSQAAEYALKAPPAQYQLPDVPKSPVKRHAVQPQPPFSQGISHKDKPRDELEQPYCNSRSSTRSPAAAAAAALPSCMQQDLRFRESSLEDNYVSSQVQQLARMDMLFVVVALCMVAGLAYTGSYSWQLLLLSCGQWLVPVAAAGWYLLQPTSYHKRRESLWVVHRVLAAMHIAGLLLYCMLQQQHAAGAVGAAGAAAAAGVTAQGLVSAQQTAAGMLRRGAVMMLVDNLGFKVRLRAHLLTLGLSVAVTAMGVLWQWSTSHGSSELSSLVPWLWELLLRLSVGCLAPTILLYWWELDERTMFLASKHCSYGGRLGGSDGGFAPAGKAKAA